MNVNEPDDGWPLGPGDLHELCRWPNEVAACLTEALSANFDFRNIIDVKNSLMYVCVCS